MDSERLVLEANRRFYDALSHLDLEAMDEIWLHEDDVVCVHPGWRMLRGWADVRESWRRIFSGNAAYDIVLEHVAAHIRGETAWVTCLERIAVVSEEGGDISMAATTNLFVSTPEGWKMSLHHASPVPSELSVPGSTQVH